MERSLGVDTKGKGERRGDAGLAMEDEMEEIGESGVT